MGEKSWPTVHWTGHKYLETIKESTFDKQNNPQKTIQANKQQLTIKKKQDPAVCASWREGSHHQVERVSWNFTISFLLRAH